MGSLKRRELYMWTRRELKECAKQLLKINYWKAVLAGVILSLIGGSGVVSVVERSSSGSFDEVIGKQCPQKHNPANILSISPVDHRPDTSRLRCSVFTLNKQLFTSHLQRIPNQNRHNKVNKQRNCHNSKCNS